VLQVLADKTLTLLAVMLGLVQVLVAEELLKDHQQADPVRTV
jgi:hypothetical protein